MGGNQSAPRKITMDNTLDMSVIKVTENVLDRLDAKTKESAKENSMNSDLNVSSNNTNPIYISSHQIRKEVDNEIEKNNLYWENRLKIVRDAYRKINTELEEEYNHAVKEVNQTLGKHYLNTSKNNTESCKQSQSSVIKCYNENKGRPLLCSEEVQKFNECVTNGMNMMMKTS